MENMSITIENGMATIVMTEDEFYNRFGKHDNFTNPQKEVQFSGDLLRVITDILKELGMPSHIKGFKFSREAIEMCVKDSNAINYVTKGIYPAIASANKTLPSRVERAIRHGIEIISATSEKYHELFEELFPIHYRVTFSKPTNSEFIATIADYIRLKSGAVNNA